ncbi:MAG: hypothetical protein F3743_02195 [Nitrospinae bacterium]|nr:hypothetical protein [Nitrospinota bacterium]MZH04195.1 hypothetical protein [Nitrospinota bacterium]MZH14211.1 hypothetical protein [Nitrospinota bacterium]
MKSILFIFLLTFSISCSGEAEKKQASEKKSKVIESPAANPLEPQTNISQEHISGSGKTHISGAPSSSHISGQ